MPILEHAFRVREFCRKARALQPALAGRDVYRVGLFCPLAELRRREWERGDRRIGNARWDSETAHTFMTYGLELDCTAPLEINVQQVEQPPMMGFAPLTLMHLPTLHRWLQQPHVREFWDDGDRTPEQVQMHSCFPDAFARDATRIAPRPD